MIVEFVEEPGTLRASGLTAMAALYRLAAAVGGTTQLGRMGDYEVKPLPATGVAPFNYLLAPLYQQPVGRPAVDLLSVATWAFTNYPYSAFAPSIVPGQPLPGRFTGRLRDLGGLFPAPNAIGQPWTIDAWNLIKSLAAFTTLFAAGVVFFLWYRYYTASRVPRPSYHRVRRNSAAAAMPKEPAGGSPSKLVVGAAPAVPPSPGLASLIALNPLNVLGMAGAGRKNITSAPKASSWTTGWMRYGRAPTARGSGGGSEGEEAEVSGVNPAHGMARSPSPRAALELPGMSREDGDV